MCFPRAAVNGALLNVEKAKGKSYHEWLTANKGTAGTAPEGVAIEGAANSILVVYSEGSLKPEDWIAVAAHAKAAGIIFDENHDGWASGDTIGEHWDHQCLS